MTHADDAQSRAKWDRLGDGWRWVFCRCPVANALLKMWARDPARTLKDVALEYSRVQAEACEKLLDFNPVMLKLVRDSWPTWREESPRIHDSDGYQNAEAQRICNQVHATMWAVMSYRSTHDKMHICPTITITYEQAKALGFNV